MHTSVSKNMFCFGFSVSGFPWWFCATLVNAAVTPTKRLSDAHKNHKEHVLFRLCRLTCLRCDLYVGSECVAFYVYTQHI